MTYLKMISKLSRNALVIIILNYLCFNSQLLFTEGTGTITEPDTFYPVQAARLLFGAFEGLYPREETVLNTLPFNPLEKRLQILQYYKDLLQRINEEGCKPYKNLMNALMRSPSDNLAAFFDIAIPRDVNKENPSNINLAYQILVSCTESQETRDEVTKAFKNLTGQEMAERLDSEEKLRGDTGSLCKEILIHMAREPLPPAGSVDPKQAEEDAKKAKDDAKVILDGRKEWDDKRKDNLDGPLIKFNFDHLARTLDEFKKMNVDHDGIERDLQHEFDNRLDGSKKELYSNLLAFDRSRIDYFASRLKQALDHPGVDHDSLILTVASRSEKDLKEIEDSFSRQYKQQLRDAIADKTAGQVYQSSLLALLSKKPN